MFLTLRLDEKLGFWGAFYPTDGALQFSGLVLFDIPMSLKSSVMDEFFNLREEEYGEEIDDGIGYYK